MSLDRVQVRSQYMTSSIQPIDSIGTSLSLSAGLFALEQSPLPTNWLGIRAIPGELLREKLERICTMAKAYSEYCEDCCRLQVRGHNMYWLSASIFM